jgi:hypothetical protein
MTQIVDDFSCQLNKLFLSDPLIKIQLNKLNKFNNFELKI